MVAVFKNVSKRSSTCCWMPRLCAVVSYRSREPELSATKVSKNACQRVTDKDRVGQHSEDVTIVPNQD